MSCKNIHCKEPRILSVSAKCNDMFTATDFSDKSDYDGYVPRNIGIGGGDYISFRYCLSCGTIQSNEFPIDENFKLNAEEE